MLRKHKSQRRHAPTLAEVEAEAVQFRQESADLRNEMLLLRNDIGETMKALDGFGATLKKETV